MDGCIKSTSVSFLINHLTYIIRHYRDGCIKSTSVSFLINHLTSGLSV